MDRGVQTDCFLDFVKENEKSNSGVLNTLNELEDKKAHIIGYFEKKEDAGDDDFRKASSNLKDECEFIAGYGDVIARMHPPDTYIVAFRPCKSRSNDDEAYAGTLLNYDDFFAWASEKCNPMVREITFENAEELTEGGIPFLILFHVPSDTDSIK